MDCNSNQRNNCTCRPQMPVPPCMNTSCGCNGSQTDIQPSQIRPIQSGNAASCQCQMPVRPMPCQSQKPIMPRAEAPAITLSTAPTLCTSAREDRVSGMPIAMAYVPWQKWKQTYSLEQGLNRGTIFPELDLPFVMGRCR